MQDRPLHLESSRFMVSKSRPRQGTTVGYHAVLTRRETRRFSDAWAMLRNWLGWQGSNLRMPIPKTGALPLGYTPARRRPYNGLRGDEKGQRLVGCRNRRGASGATPRRARGRLPYSALPSKSAAEWRSRNCSSSSPQVLLTIRPRLTAGRSAIAFTQRSTCRYSWIERNLRASP